MFFFFPQQAQHSPGPRASHRKALGWATAPASNRKHTARHPHQRQTRKNGGIPPTRRGSINRLDHAPSGHRPYDHNGESPRKAGQRPEQLYTGPVQKRALALYKNAHCTQGGTGAPKGGLTRYTEALHNDCHANLRCTHGGRKAEKVSGGGESPHRAQECKSVRIATQPTLPRRKP